MRLYRKVVPKIARDVIVALGHKKLIEVDEGKISEAELDLAAVMVEFLNAEERVIKEAKEVLARRGLGPERFKQMVKSVAEVRHVKIGDDGVDYVLAQLIEALMSSNNVSEVFGEDHEIRKVIKEVTDKYLSIPEEIDKETRSRLKNIREGTPEWEIEYPRLVSMLKKQKGLV